MLMARSPAVYEEMLKITRISTSKCIGWSAYFSGSAGTAVVGGAGTGSAAGGRLEVVAVFEAFALLMVLANAAAAAAVAVAEGGGWLCRFLGEDDADGATGTFG